MLDVLPGAMYEKRETESIAGRMKDILGLFNSRQASGKPVEQFQPSSQCFVNFSISSMITKSPVTRDLIIVG